MSVKSPLLSHGFPNNNYGSNEGGINQFLRTQRKNQIDGLQGEINKLTQQLPALENRIACVKQDAACLYDFENSVWAKATVIQGHLPYIKLPGVKVGDRFTREIFSSLVEGQKGELAMLIKIPEQIRQLSVQLESLKRTAL